MTPTDIDGALLVYVLPQWWIKSYQTFGWLVIIKRCESDFWGNETLFCRWEAVYSSDEEAEAGGAETQAVKI